jgi:hypothetical protein
MPSNDAKHGSTRVAIVERSLMDSLERLSDIEPSPRVRELRTKADAYMRALRGWKIRPPTEEQRAALLKVVLELNVEVMRAGREGQG